MSEVVLLLSTFPDVETARATTHALLAEKLVACGNIVPGLESIYTWKGAVETSAEVFVIFKTTADRAEAAIGRIAALHPYEVPEVLQFPATGGWPPYFAWVRESVAE